MSNLKTTDNFGELLKALRLLSRTTVLVGVPSDDEEKFGATSENQRTDVDITNAQIGYINEFGAPEVNIPPRPHLIPGVEQAMPEITRRLRAAGDAAFAARPMAATKNFHAAGLTAQASVRNVIARGIPPPLAPATVAARRRRSAGSTYRRKAATASDVTPLIDTGDYVGSISYVVRTGRSTV